MQEVLNCRCQENGEHRPYGWNVERVGDVNDTERLVQALQTFRHANKRYFARNRIGDWPKGISQCHAPVLMPVNP